MDQDHPRSRGVYEGAHSGFPSRGGIIPARAGFTRSSASSVHPVAGSSPLARGLPARRARVGRRARIIPARAGFTCPSGTGAPLRPDHPRSRGVYGRPSMYGAISDGSSPLARGLPGRESTRSRTQGDHPRSRGVYGGPGGDRLGVGGSSPLARGLPRPARRVQARGGIIPARAGFTACARCTASTSPDHPRSRGVYSSRARSISRIDGSSPLARGLHGSYGSVIGVLRIIPARAGFTLQLNSCLTVRRDHPRSRGVYTLL